jgi:hypothetical protein
MSWYNNRFLPLLWQFLLITYRTNKYFHFIEHTEVSRGAGIFHLCVGRLRHENLLSDKAFVK